jgi:hypothetical protein
MFFRNNNKNKSKIWMQLHGVYMSTIVVTFIRLSSIKPNPIWILLIWIDFGIENIPDYILGAVTKLIF